MRLDLAERLRCPNPHVATPLVVVASQVDGRDLRRGFAGCPVCQLELRFEDGVAVFAPEPTASAPDAALDATLDAARATAARAASGDADAAWQPSLERVVALLGLAEPGGAVLLTGRYAALAESLAVAAEVTVVVMATAVPAVLGESVARVEGLVSAVPFGDATFRAVALDGDPAMASARRLVEDAVRATSVGGRVLAVASMPRPADTRELARDAAEWVAEREARSAPVSLRRR